MDQCNYRTDRRGHRHNLSRDWEELGTHRRRISGSPSRWLRLHVAMMDAMGAKEEIRPCRRRSALGNAIGRLRYLRLVRLRTTPGGQAVLSLRHWNIYPSRQVRMDVVCLWLEGPRLSEVPREGSCSCATTGPIGGSSTVTIVSWIRWLRCPKDTHKVRDLTRVTFRDSQGRFLTNERRASSCHCKCRQRRP